MHGLGKGWKILMCSEACKVKQHIRSNSKPKALNSNITKMIFSSTLWGFFFTPPQTVHWAYFFRLFSKKAKLCDFNVPYCILRWIWCSWTHFWQYFDMVHTLWLSITSKSDKVAQKWLILAIFPPAGSKGQCTVWGNFVDFLKVLPQVLKCYPRYLDMSTGPREAIWTP